MTNLFSNQLPERLDRELKVADSLGINPLKVGSPEFDKIINDDIVKWAITIEGQLLFIPKFVNGQEIYHTIITRGQPVLAAGEANIIGSKGKYLLLNISNHSGHFQTGRNALEIGINAFKQEGIDTTKADIEYTE